MKALAEGVVKGVVVSVVKGVAEDAVAASARALSPGPEGLS